MEIATDMNGDIQQPDEPLEGAAEVDDEIALRLQLLLQMLGLCFVGICFNTFFSGAQNLFEVEHKSLFYCFISNERS